MTLILNEMCIKHKALKQITTMCYFGYGMSYKVWKNMSIKILHLIKIPRIMNRVSRASSASRHTRIWSYEAVARPTLPCYSEPWTIELDYYVMAKPAQRREVKGKPDSGVSPLWAAASSELKCLPPQICSKRMWTHSCRIDTKLVVCACAITL
jgi:hypothetical protein